MTDKIQLTDLTPDEMAQALDIKAFQGRQLFHWIHGRQVFDPDLMTNLSKPLREAIKEKCALPQLTFVRDQVSGKTGTRKVLYRLADGETVESVLLRHGRRITICLSTQVGCKIRCDFCATGLSGFTRDLTTGEIVEQALHLLAEEELGEQTPNIVYMGMGEPLFNYDATIQSAKQLMHEEGLNIGARKITVSTVGVAPAIKRFADEKWQVRLSISVHAANDKLRQRLVPLNRKYPLADLLDACRYYNKHSGRQITLEWTLIKDVNDSLRDAEEFVKRFRGIKAGINLIPFNPVEERKYEQSPPGRCKAFCKTLTDAGFKATLRGERGGDIDAACGQLRRRELEA